MMHNTRSFFFFSLGKQSIKHPIYAVPVAG